MGEHAVARAIGIEALACVLSFASGYRKPAAWCCEADALGFAGACYAASRRFSAWEGVVGAVRSWATSRDGGFGQCLIRRRLASVALVRFMAIERGSVAFGYGKNRTGPTVLPYEMPHYDEAGLVRLLRLLRAAPGEWVRRAQRIPLRTVTLTDRDVEELGAKLERDESFRRAFDSDPVAAVKAAGMADLAYRLEYEIGELVALAGQVARDASRGYELATALSADETEPESVLELLSGSEVVAHAAQPRPLEERALLLALTSAAVTNELRATVSY